MPTRFLPIFPQYQVMRRPMSVTLLPTLVAMTAMITPMAAALVSMDSTDRLHYSPDAKGNVIPDFSYCGYAAGEKGIPTAAVRITLQPPVGDAGALIQTAIDKVSALPAGPDGLRGAVLLDAGRYEIGGTLKIKAGGVVLRGMGNSTILFASGKTRRTLIEVDTPPGASTGVQIEARAITDDFVPLGTRSFRVASVADITSELSAL